MSTQRSFLLCFAQLSSGCVAFDSARIGEFSEATSDDLRPAGAAEGERAPLDLVELFGLPPYGPDAARRTVVVEGEGLPLVILVGEELRLQTVELADFLKLPPLLEGIETAIGVTGLVRRGDELAMFVDVGVLADIARRRATP